jgi:glycosyltransferase involved in cell wall biosynthesis
MDKPLRIIIVSKDFLPNIGGIAAHVYFLAKHLVLAGAAVRLLTTRKDIDSKRNIFKFSQNKYTLEGIEVTEVPLLYTPGLYRYQYSWRYTNILRNWLKDQFQVIHYHFWNFDAQVAMPLSGTVPMVMTNHSSSFLRYQNDPKKSVLLKRSLESANKLIAPSKELIDASISLGFPKPDTYYIPNGVDINLFKPDPMQRIAKRLLLNIKKDDIVIFCARRPVPKNGLIYFVKSLQRVSKPECGQIVVLFAGFEMETTYRGSNSEYEDEIKNVLKDLPSFFKIIPLGKVRTDNMAAFYQASDICVMPSLQEATSLSLCEAMASGLAIVATNVGGIPELISNGIEGILVEPGDHNKFAEGLNKILTDQKLRENFGLQALKKILSGFTWEELAKRTLEVYENAIIDFSSSSLK